MSTVFLIIDTEGTPIMTENSIASTDTTPLGQDATDELRLFARYLVVPGIQDHLLLTMGDEIPQLGENAPGVLLNRILTSLFRISGLGQYRDFEAERFINGAASLHLIVGYARKVDPAVIPPAVIPSDNTVQECLTLFHIRHAKASRV